MTFGAGQCGSDEASSRSIFDAYVDTGGNFVDAADVYSGGESEAMLGRFIVARNLRDKLVIATQSGFPRRRATPLARGQRCAQHPRQHRRLAAPARDGLHRSVLDPCLGLDHAGRGSAARVDRRGALRARRTLWLLQRSRLVCCTDREAWAVQRRYMSFETLAPISDPPNVSLPAVAA
jgi:hypothetical protein